MRCSEHRLRGEALEAGVWWQGGGPCLLRAVRPVSVGSLRPAHQIPRPPVHMENIHCHHTFPGSPFAEAEDHPCTCLSQLRPRLQVAYLPVLLEWGLRPAPPDKAMFSLVLRPLGLNDVSSFEERN